MGLSPIQRGTPFPSPIPANSSVIVEIDSSSGVAMRLREVKTKGIQMRTAKIQMGNDNAHVLSG